MTGPIRNTTGERIQDAFVESPTRSGMSAVESFIGNAADLKSINGPLTDVDWNNFDYQYPLATQEIIRLFKDTTLKATITLNYTSTTKEFLLNGTVAKI